VAWRDIERAYRSQIDTFQPKATATLGRIRIKTAGNEERIKLIDQELDAGVTFITVAKQAKMPKDGVWQTFQLPEGGLEDISLNEFYKPYLKQIQDGGTTGSFERGSWTMWISLLEVMRPTARSLDEPDVQRMLQNQLMRDRSQRAEWEYVNGLLQRGIHDEIGAMVNRALLIAISRFPPK
jgi:predicted metal-dependent peptidase